MSDLITGALAGLLDAVLRTAAAVIVGTVQRAIDHPSATTAVAALLAISWVGQGIRLRRLGLLAGVTMALPFAILAVTWREFGRYRRATWLGVIAGVPAACALVALTSPPARANAIVVAAVWALIVFFPGDLLWAGQTGGLLYQRIGRGTIRQWWRHEAARETIESSFRRTIDPRVQVSRVRPDGDGRWQARVLVPEKLSPNVIEDKADDHTIGSTCVRVGKEKGFAETIQDVVVRPDRAQGQGVQAVTVLTGSNDPLASISRWELPDTQPAALEPVCVGRFSTGEPVLVPVPGVGGGHVLLGGESGSGKTTVEDAFIGQLALRDDIAILASDPKFVGMAKWEKRLTTLTLGIDTATPLLVAAADLMDQRKRRLLGVELEDWDLSLGPWVVVVFDEAGVLGLGKDGENARRLFEILSQGRALGVGLLVAMHRPSTSKLQGDLRDLFPVRIGLAMGSNDASQMIFGDQAPPAHKISEQEKGVGYVRIHRQTHRFRSHLHPLEAPPRRLAEATAHLRVPSTGEFAGWPHRIEDPSRQRDRTAWEEFLAGAPAPKRRTGRALANEKGTDDE